MTTKRKIDISKTVYSKLSKHGWCRVWIDRYKWMQNNDEWLFDQLLRIMLGTEIIIVEEEFPNGHRELHYTLGNPSKRYIEYIVQN